MKIGVVGVCASGKTTLISQLNKAGYNAKHIAQEHSYVPDMWKKITNPDILIYLQASYQTTLKRRKFDWRLQDWEEQVHRLKNARENANIIVETDHISPEQVFQAVVEYFSKLD